MNSGQTAERVYDAIKLRIRNRAFRPGERLDPAPLASELMSSVTPVRDALNRLTGEQLVETRTSDGFRLPPVDEPWLKDLYDWNLEVLMLAIRAWPGRIEPPVRPREADPALLVASHFHAIGERSANAEHCHQIENLNDRLHAVRLCEGAVLDDATSELAAIGAAIHDDRRAGLRRLVVGYHRRRRRAAAEIVRALYRAPPIIAE